MKQHKLQKSREIFNASSVYIPGGVNSPVRAYGKIGTIPPCIESAKGAYITDVDGNRYIDYVGSWGPMILGHSDDDVISSVTETAARGTSFGAPSMQELQLAELVCQAVPSVEKVRMVSSGTEACMSAIRLARGYTQREYIVKFEGCYHGHSDGLLVKAGSGALTSGIPDSAGVPKGYAQTTLTLPYNDGKAVSDLFSQMGEQIAAVIFEPVAGNMGVIESTREFRETLREVTQHYGAVLIADEVITGFRLGYGGAQEKLQFTPDLSVFGKIIGGGLPVGAFGGRREIMDYLSPLGPVYQAGTLSGNPLAMTAGYTTLEKLKDNPSLYEDLERKSGELQRGMESAGKQYAVPLRINRSGSILSLFFCDFDITSYEDVLKTDADRFVRYFMGMQKEGINLAPSPYEAMFVSVAHSDEEIDLTLEAVNRTLKNLS